MVADLRFCKLHQFFASSTFILTLPKAVTEYLLLYPLVWITAVVSSLGSS